MTWNYGLGKFLRVGLFALSFLFCGPVRAQMPAVVTSHPLGASTLPIGGTLLQDVGSISQVAGCTTSSTTCTFNIMPTTAGSTFIIYAYPTNNVFISSASITGGSFNACPAGGSFNEKCNAYNATGGGVDAKWGQGATAGTNTVSVTLSGVPGGSNFFAEFVEFLPSPGQTITGLDASGSLIQTSCTTCNGVALTTTATDFIVQGAFNAAQFTNAWNSVSSPWIISHAQSIFSPNVAAGSVAAPVLTMAAAGSVPFSALAFKTSAASYSISPSPLFALVNATPAVAGAVNTSCNPSCTVTIPSTTNGNLLFVATAATSSVTVSSVTDGGDSFTPCLTSGTSGGNITVTGQTNALSCAYAVTGGSKTSVVITMSGNASVGVLIFEGSRTGGSWTLDAQGSVQRSAPGTSHFTGVDLSASITGSNDFCFAGFFNTGGAISVQQYPFSYTTLAGGGTYILNNQASEVALPGTYYGSLAGTGGPEQWLTNQNVASAFNKVCFK